MFDAIDVANYIICRLKNQNRYITSLKLQKMLYYVAAWYYQKNQKLLFSDSIEKWKFGPVVPSVYHAFKDYGYMAIQGPTARYNVSFFGAISEMTSAYPKELDMIDGMLELVEDLDCINVNNLVDYTHEELAWKSVEENIYRGERDLLYSFEDLDGANLSFIGR